MEFEWDEAKRLANIGKHGFDFVSILELLDGDHLRARTRDGKGGEERWRAVGIVKGRYACAIYTMRGDTVRVISLRAARDEEREKHRAVFG